MANYLALKTQIASTTYSGMTDAQIVAALNTANIAVTQDVPVASVEAYFELHGLLMAVQGFIASPPAGASSLSIAAAHGLLAIIQSPHVQTVQMSDPATNATVAAMLGALVNPGTAAAPITGPLAAADQSAILAMASGQATSWAAENGWPNGLTVNDLVAARAM